jgi:copper chaperone CopZ
METMTKSSRTIQIDGMTGDACTQKVTGALKAVRDIAVESVKVGSATINADKAGSQAACSAINGAGYRARDGETKAGGCAMTGLAGESKADAGTAPGTTAAKPPVEHATPGHSPSPIQTPVAPAAEPMRSVGGAQPAVQVPAKPAVSVN